MTPSVMGDAPVAGAPAAAAPAAGAMAADFLAVLAAAVVDAAPAADVTSADPTVEGAPVLGAPIARGAEPTPVTIAEAFPADAAATPPAPFPSPAPRVTSPVAAPGTEAGLPLPTGCSCCAAPSAPPSPPAGPGRAAPSAATWGRAGAVSAPLAPRVAVAQYSADVVRPAAPTTIEVAAFGPAPATAPTPSTSTEPAASVTSPAADQQPEAVAAPVRSDVAPAAALPPSFDRPPLPDGSPHLAGGRGPSRSAARPVSHSIVRPLVSTGDAPVPPTVAQAAAVAPPNVPQAAASVTSAPVPSALSTDRPVVAGPGVPAERIAPLAPRALDVARPTRVAATDDLASDGGDANTGDAVSDLVPQPASLPAGTAPARATVTAASSPPAMPSSLGMVGTERVETVRRLQGTQPLQRLSVDLDDTKVAVRVRGDRLSVDVVSDPQGVLGDSWARQVERTLDQAVRLQDPSPRHEAPRAAAAEQGASGGARHSDRHQSTPDDGERRQRRQFVWDLEEER